jgi:hypothetical protein
MSTINLESKLSEVRRKEKNLNFILEEVETILNENAKAREKIEEKLKSPISTKENNFDFELLETDKIFHLNHIQKICIDYRLRFLDSSLFKNEIPEEAISKICDLERKHNTKLQGFKIVAPSKAFHLENYDDPILFAPIGNNYYYLIYKWGNEFTPFRKTLVRPIKDMGSFVVFCLLLSLVLTWITPTSKLSNVIPMADIIVFLFVFKSIIAVAAYYFFMLGKNFNTEIWQRKYYNN